MMVIIFGKKDKMNIITIFDIYNFRKTIINLLSLIGERKKRGKWKVTN